MSENQNPRGLCDLLKSIETHFSFLFSNLLSFTKSLETSQNKWLYVSMYIYLKTVIILANQTMICIKSIVPKSSTPFQPSMVTKCYLLVISSHTFLYANTLSLYMLIICIHTYIYFPIPHFYKNGNILYISLFNSLCNILMYLGHHSVLIIDLTHL